MRFSSMGCGLLIATALLLAGCGGDAEVLEPGVTPAPNVVPLGKEDNFLSPSAQEYLVEGTTTITLDEEDWDLSATEKLKAAKRLVPFKQIAIGWFLHSYIAPKDGKDKNSKYGGFNALTKNGAYEDLAIEPIDDKSFSFTFRQELGGPLDLLSKLPVQLDGDGTATFDLVVGKPTNEQMTQLAINDEWYREKEWEHFDPAQFPPEKLETVRLTITPQPRSLDAWPDYKRLFEDGEVTISIHFGWDYNAEDHLRLSKKMYKWLVSAGYSSPAKDYESLTRKSGPFERTITADGETVSVKIWLFWGKPGTDTDPDTGAGGKKLEADMRTSLEKREVIIYSGHSGPFYGFALANWKKTDEGDLDDAEIPELDLPDTYQVILAEGCETYALGQAFWSNPAKSDRQNLDIITTTTYSTATNADPTKDFLEAMVGVDSEGRHHPVTYGQLLQDLDWNAWEPAMYGVHGIDDNPRLHPYANKAQFCDPCETDWDCGTAFGNVCVNLGTDGQICSGECTADDGCPTGYTCAALAQKDTISGHACVPRNYSCAGDPPAAVGVVITEILADVPNGPDGDANGDGWYDAGEDEFVEIRNVGDEPVPIGGWTLSDGVKVRFSFPPAISLPAGAVAVVFGGGDPQALTDSGALLFTASAGLQLGNSGDSVILRLADGRVADRVTYGAEADGDRSIVRGEGGEFAPSEGSVLFTPGE